jgi:tetratricopeptide (TPR) repeat protein
MASRCFAIAFGVCFIAALAVQTRAHAEAGMGPGPIAVSAQVRDRTGEEARKQHHAGVEAFAAGQYDEAIAAFLTADALHPSSETAFNIAKAYEAQGDNSHALEYYREYLRRSPAATDRDGVSKRVVKLSQKIALKGVQQATFIVTPIGSAVLVDSEPIGAAPVTLDLPPGKHTVEFRKAGFTPATFQFELPVDRPVDVVAKLASGKELQGQAAISTAPRTSYPLENEAGAESTDARSAERIAPSEVAKAKRGSLTRTVGFAALGASVAAIGGAVTLEVMRSRAEQEAKRETDQVGYSEALERMRSRQTMARVFAGAGGALAALGGVMLAVASGASSGEKATEKPTVTDRPKKEGIALSCLPGRCHAMYSGTF